MSGAMVVYSEPVGVGQTAPLRPGVTAPPQTQTQVQLPPGVWFKGEAVAAIAFGTFVVGAAVTYVVMRSKKGKRR